MLGISSLIINESHAAKIYFGDYEKISKIYDLPQTDEYVSSKGEYFDLGYKFTVFQIASIPIYQIGKSKVIGLIYLSNLNRKRAYIEYISPFSIYELDSLFDTV